MIPGTQRFFKRQPSEYERNLQDRVNSLEEQLKQFNSLLSGLHDEYSKEISELRRELLGYIKPESEVAETEPEPVGVRTFTQRRREAMTKAATRTVKAVADKTAQVMAKEQSNG